MDALRALRPLSAFGFKDLLGVLCLTPLLVFCFLNFTWKNDFPYYYHFDEPIKVNDVIHNRPQFKHPLVLINSTQIALQISAAPAECQEIVVLGRTMSAVFACVAILAFMLLAYYYGGFWGALAFAIPVSFSTPLLSAAHTMKEDAALMMGIGLALLAFTIFQASMSRKTLILLAISVGLAASCKYPALVLLVLAVFVLRKLKPELEPIRLKIGKRELNALQIFFLFFGLTIIVLNYQMLVRFWAVFAGMWSETHHIITSHQGIVTRRPYLFYARQLELHLPLPILVLCLAYVGLFLTSIRRRSWAEWMEIVFVAVYTGIILLASFVVDRYYLPIDVFAYYFAAKGLIELSRLALGACLGSSPPGWALQGLQMGCAALLVGGTLALKLPQFSSHLHAYEQDARHELQDWIDKNLPPTAVIAQDGHVNLPTRGVKLHEDAAGVVFPAQKILHAQFAADLGSLEELRERGVTHIAVNRFKRFFDPENVPTADAKEIYLRRKRFYEELSAVGSLVWQSEQGPTLLQPPIRLYAISDYGSSE